MRSKDVIGKRVVDVIHETQPPREGRGTLGRFTSSLVLEDGSIIWAWAQETEGDPIGTLELIKPDAR